MKNWKNYALFVALALLTAALAPKAKSVYSSPVTVQNTSANAVPIVEAGTPFQAALCVEFGPVSAATNLCSANQDKFTVPTTTASGLPVKMLVAENVSGFCSSFQNPGLFIKSVRLRGHFVSDSVSNGNATFTHYVPIVGPAYSYVNDPTFGPPLGGTQETDTSYGQTTEFFLNPGDTVNVEPVVFLANNVAADYLCVARVEGHLVTQ